MNKKAPVKRITVRLPEEVKARLQRQAYERAMSTALYARCLITSFTESFVYRSSRTLVSRHRFDVENGSRGALHTPKKTETLDNDHALTFRVPVAELDIVKELATKGKSTTAEILREVLLHSVWDRDQY